MDNPQTTLLMTVLVCVLASVLAQSGSVEAQVVSSQYLSLLPEGQTKKRFILDCTGCHQFDSQIVNFDGKTRSKRHWISRTAQMVQFFGGSGVFPVMSPSRDPEETADWLVTHLGDSVAPPPVDAQPGEISTDAEITEYDIPNPQDLPHDLMVAPDGRVVITGMMSHQMYVLDPESGNFETAAIPVENANPRALDVDDDGNWWVLLGAPERIAHYDKDNGAWSSWPVGTYPHSIVRDDSGRVWFNGHFSKEPEILGYLDPATGAVVTFAIPVPPMDDGGSNIPYGLRIAPDGSLWMTELVGNRLIEFDPESEESDVHELPTSFSGPRRLDVAPDGTVWIPEYANNRIARFDPETESFEEFELPVDDSLPYILRVHPHSGEIWIATAAADAVFRFEPESGRFSTYRVPTHSALMRHMDIDPATGDVWVAYGNFPAVEPKVARIRSVDR